MDMKPYRCLRFIALTALTQLLFALSLALPSGAQQSSETMKEQEKIEQQSKKAEAALEKAKIEEEEAAEKAKIKEE